MCLLRKRIFLTNAIPHKQFDALSSWHLRQNKLRPGRVKGIANGFAKAERPIKCSCERDASLVTDPLTRADGVIDHFGDGARLRFGEAGIEQDQSQMMVVETQHLHEALLIDCLATARRSTKNDLMFFACVAAEVNDVRF